MDYRLDLPTGVRVRPDIVFTKARIAIFYDSCFWHACPSHGRQPSVNEWYWTPKLERTAARDRRATEALKDAGWEVIRIWEHDDLAAAADRIERFVPRPRKTSALARTFDL
jgi:DNA mismatch endonuclease, patch repair protein